MFALKSRVEGREPPAPFFVHQVHITSDFYKDSYSRSLCTWNFPRPAKLYFILFRILSSNMAKLSSRNVASGFD